MDNSLLLKQGMEGSFSHDFGALAVSFIVLYLILKVLLKR